MAGGYNIWLLTVNLNHCHLLSRKLGNFMCCHLNNNLLMLFKLVCSHSSGCFHSLLAVKLWTYYFSTRDYTCIPYTPSWLLLLWWGFSHPNLSALLQSVSLVSSLLPFIFIFTGWTVYHQTSERVTYKSSSKPRTRFLSGPVSLSICLYFFFSISSHWIHLFI